MGLFSDKDQTSKPGSFQVAWPKESGLGVGSYSLEAEAQERYLIYTADRRSQESVPVEDMPVMQAAKRQERAIPPFRTPQVNRLLPRP